MTRSDPSEKGKETGPPTAGAFNDKREMDAERKHLETLLKDRLNFYLVFASLFVLGLYRGIPSPEFEVLLVAGMIISLMLFLAVLRTHRLVQAALTEIKGYQPRHPYRQLVDRVAWPRVDANKYLILIPLVLTLAFFLLLVKAGIDYRLDQGPPIEVRVPIE